MFRSPYEWDVFASQLMQGSLISAILGENLERKLHIPKKRCSSVTDVGVVISVTALTLSGIGWCPSTV